MTDWKKKWFTVWLSCIDIMTLFMMWLKGKIILNLVVWQQDLFVAKNAPHFKANPFKSWHIWANSLLTFLFFFFSRQNRFQSHFLQNTLCTKDTKVSLKFCRWSCELSSLESHSSLAECKQVFGGLWSIGNALKNVFLLIQLHWRSMSMISEFTYQESRLAFPNLFTKVV